MQVETPEEIKKIIKSMQWISFTPENQKYNFVVGDDGFKIQEHRYIWEKHNGKIPQGGVIHHINGDRKDNRIQNLMLTDFLGHMKIHKGRRLTKGS